MSYHTWFPVGSGDEESGKTGISHLFEHLMFKATNHLPEGEFDRRLEALGGNVNAATWLDWTYYYEDLPSAHFEVVVDLEADRLQNLLLTPEQLEPERKVVINERKECVEDSPDGLLDEALYLLAFGEGHPYAHPTIGWMSDIEGITQSECEMFYRAHYAPNRAVVVVCGDLERPRLFSAIERAYGSISPQPPPPLRPRPAPTLSGPKTHRISLDLSAPRVHIGLIAFTVLDERLLALETLDELLFSGDSARLYRKLVVDNEWATDVYSSVPSFKGVGLYEVTLELTAQAPIESAIELFFNELREIIEHGLNPGELDKVKCHQELSAYRNLQTYNQRAHALGFWEVTTGRFDFGFERVQALSKVSEAQVIEIAHILLEPSRKFIVYGDPTTHSATHSVEDSQRLDIQERSADDEAL
jgi:zinc protease